MEIIRFSKTTSLYEELTPFYNPTKAEEFFMQFDFHSPDSLYWIAGIKYGINITNTDADVWIEDTHLNILDNLPTELMKLLLNLIEEFYFENHPEDTLLLEYTL